MTRHLRLPALASAIFIVALGLSACGNNSASQTSSSPAPSSSTPMSASASPTPSASPSSSPASASASAPASNTGGLARCVSTQLSASLAPGAGGAAGHVYAKIVLKNTGSSACLLSGFAGVSLTNGPDGGPIGAPADRDQSVPPVDITLNPGQSGAADFGYTQAGLYAGSCTEVQAAGIRIYPPEDYGSLFIPDQQTACSEAGLHLLTIRSFQPM
ncbi:DUF4232 domain-containing protein [Sinomonas albida]|uniref:DUF4232 domain-containing protein n=1 Tax=Sinomonas albida TaxID=369942 RepID=UPI0030168D7C